jgi:hypothetical protein
LAVAGPRRRTETAGSSPRSMRGRNER